ncbi:hypothetical protein RBB77_22280 [Tunturibacter psychrotolerans]|uniref:Glycosyltransferase RgtA/B/C/D-like domain-containing protein n=1 Tax=Tunturiibacter psychrotolerans TaxID=3069686 RepID=A0AAU7ZQ60_9BACT
MAQVNAWINRAYRWAALALLIWLLVWIGISWAGVQDDAFIHLRYAENLLHTHLVTYDGVHPNYGASSLLYIYLLSFLRPLSASPNLPRLVSSCIHVLLLVGVAVLFFRATPRESSLARLLGLIVMTLLVTPSSVRWLDDGMETGIALCFVALICWLTFRESEDNSVTPVRYAACTVLGFLAVFLRVELILLCGIGSLLIAWKHIFAPDSNFNLRLRSILSASHLLLGGLLAMLFIVIKMHHLLPDTAKAKADGIADWQVAFSVTAKVLAGGLSFGAGIFIFWLLTLYLLLRASRLSPRALVANSIFPILFSIAAIRGQQIQGARYFVWSFFFSALWNSLELTLRPIESESKSPVLLPAYCFLALALFALPIESKVMYPFLRDRATLVRSFQSNHLETLEGKRGIAFDIGQIGYFSRADICDLAGLVNGRSNAGLTEDQHFTRCVATNPDFLFLHAEAVYAISHYLPIKDWQLCGLYPFRRVDKTDQHYLLARRSEALEICKDPPPTPPELQPLLQ